MHTSIPLCACAAVSILIIGSRANVHAQTVAMAASTPPNAMTGVRTLDSVDVDAQDSSTIGTTDAASEGTVSGSVLNSAPLLRPGEVLEKIPGMVVTQHSGDGKANQYFLRGYNLDHGTDFASSVDQVPVNMPTNAHAQGYSDLNFLIPELVDDVTYHKGPYSAESGDFSAAGAANIAYRKQLSTPYLALTAGSHQYRRALFAGSTALSPDKTLLAAVEAVGQNGPWKTPEDMRKFNGLLRASSGTEQRGWSADAVIYQAAWNSSDQIPLAAIQSGELSRFGSANPTDGGTTGRDILSGEWHVSDESGYMRAFAYAEHYRLRLFSDFTFYELRPATGDQFEQLESRNLTGGRIVRGWMHTLFGHDSTTEVGIQVRHDAIRVGLANTQDRVVYDTVDDNQVRETSVGLYAENTINWTRLFRSVIGIREDCLWMDLNERVTRANSGSADACRTSPKASLIFGPWHATELFLNAGSGFHSNDARGSIYRIDPTTGGPASRVPPLVGAEGSEIGLRSEWIPHVQTSLALWRLNSSSELVYNADSDIGSTQPNGASSRDGVEWNNRVAINHWLSFDADLAYTHARFSAVNANGQIGAYIPNAVSKVGLVGITAQDLAGWTLGARMRYIGAYPLTQDGQIKGPSSFVTDLRIEHGLFHGALLRLDVLNTFNRRYYDMAYAQDYQLTPQSAVVRNGVTVHPGEPREFRVTLKLDL